jgi:hypothetical protein
MVSGYRTKDQVVPENALNECWQTGVMLGNLAEMSYEKGGLEL